MNGQMNKRKDVRRRLGPKLIRTVLALVSVTFVAFFVIAAAELFQINRNREIENQRSQLAQAAARISSMQSTVRNIASLIVYNDVIQKGITSQAGNVGEELYAARRISDTLKEYLHILDGTEEITVYTADGRTLTSRYVRGNIRPEETEWLTEFLESGKTSGFTGVHTSAPWQSGYVTDVISYITDYYSIKEYGVRLGELIISVEYRTLLDMIRIGTSLLDGYVLYDGNGGILVSEGSMKAPRIQILEETRDGLYDAGRNGIYVVSDAMEDGWVLISEISGKELIRRSLVAVLPFFAVFLILLAALGVILSIQIRRVVDPVNELGRAAEAVGRGDFSASVDIHTQDEIEDLAHAFNHMVEDVNQLMNASVEHEKKIQQMQTENLMLQINPHFIYNTMNSIVYMARMSGNTQIADFTNAFISLLQSTLRVRSSVYITLEEELKNVRNYLVLQEYRYGNKFEFEITCPDELLPCQVLNVLLQPVVENAIFHGIAPKDGPGRIDIVVTRIEEDSVSGIEDAGNEQLAFDHHESGPESFIQKTGILQMTVSDDGIGMDEKTLSELLKTDYIQKGGVHKIGIGNVYERIREVYGDPYTLTVESTPGKGTVVVIRIPVQYREPETD